MGEVIYLYDNYKTGEKTMRYHIRDVAKELLKFESMTHKKLQKLCYYVQALHLAIYGEPLIDTYFEAWVHGPVAPELYNEYKSYGMMQIPNFAGDSCIDSNNKNFIKMVYEIYGGFSANQLERMSHTEDPWINARKGYGVYEICNNTIENDDMQLYYREKLLGIINGETKS